MQNLYIDLTVKFWCLSHLQMTSSLSLAPGGCFYIRFLSFVACRCTVTSLCALISRSHLFQCHILPVGAFLSLASSKTFGNSSLNGTFVHHRSFQNDTLAFLPGLKDTPDWKISFILITPYQKLDALDDLRVSPYHLSFFGPYLSHNSFYNCPLSLLIYPTTIWSVEQGRMSLDP